MVVEDEERRRIGRALHDSLGQYLAVLNMNLSLLQSKVGSETESVLFSECAEPCGTVCHRDTDDIASVAPAAAGGTWLWLGYAFICGGVFSPQRFNSYA